MSPIVCETMLLHGVNNVAPISITCVRGFHRIDFPF